MTYLIPMHDVVYLAGRRQTSQLCCHLKKSSFLKIRSHYWPFANCQQKLLTSFYCLQFSTQNIDFVQISGKLYHVIPPGYQELHIASQDFPVLCILLNIKSILFFITNLDFSMIAFKCIVTNLMNTYLLVCSTTCISWLFQNNNANKNYALNS